jgi:hypothetical protein
MVLKEGCPLLRGAINYLIVYEIWTDKRGTTVYIENFFAFVVIIRESNNNIRTPVHLRLFS